MLQAYLKVLLLVGAASIISVLLAKFSEVNLPMLPPDATLLGIVGTFATPLVAALAGWLAWISYRMNRAAAIVARFQKGAELVSDGHGTLATAGIALLLEVCREDRKRYLSPTVGLLQTAIHEANRDFTEKFYGTEVTDRDAQFPESRVSPARLLKALSQLCPKGAWPTGVVLWQDKLILSRLYLSNHQILDLEMSKVSFFGIICVGAKFRNCTFRNCQFAGAFSQTSFVNCRLVDCEFDVQDTKKRRHHEGGLAHLISFSKNTSLENVKFTEIFEEVTE